MAIVFRKPAGDAKPKELRLSLPPDLWVAVSMVAEREELDPQEIIRQVLEHSLRKELRQLEAYTTPKYLRRFVETILERSPDAPAELRKNSSWLDEFLPNNPDLSAALSGPQARAMVVRVLLERKGLSE